MLLDAVLISYPSTTLLAVVTSKNIRSALPDASNP
jgi:hypothetical protein